MKKFELAKKIKELGVKKAFVADKLGMTRQGLEYHLSGDDEADKEIVEKIFEILPFRKVEVSDKRKMGNIDGDSNFQNAGDGVIVNNAEIVKYLQQIIEEKNNTIKLLERQVEFYKDLAGKSNVI